MITYSGKTVNEGIAVAKIKILKGSAASIERVSVCDAKMECGRLSSSIEVVREKLKESEEKLAISDDKTIRDTKEIIAAHVLLLEDESEGSLFDRANGIIREEAVNAEYAVHRAMELVCDEFSKTQSDYLRARVEDVHHVGKMIINELCGCEDDFHLSEPSIIVTSELSPEVLASLQREYVKGIVTVTGTPLSHTAIVATNMNIPYITGVNFDDVYDISHPLEEIGLDESKMAILDAAKGVLYFDPDELMIDGYKKKSEREADKAKENIKKLSDIMPRLPIKLYANIANADEALLAAEDGAAGVGLFRSEFLYMDRETLPSEQEQYEAYVRALDAFDGKPVIIRTIDIGADKSAECVSLPKETNPALGTRGIRISFSNEELFTTQLSALLRASYNHNLKIMFPMIASRWEVEKAIETVKKVAAALKEEGIPTGNPSMGIMVETPAAVLTLEEIAPLIDFVSIGTNDLTQYTLALDRLSGKLDEYYDAHHPAVLTLISMAAKKAHLAGIEVGICGALGADTSLAQFFIDTGIDELSMSPNKIPLMADAIFARMGNSTNNGTGERAVEQQPIVAPIDGVMIPMEEIPDETFSSGIMGQCIGIYPESGEISAPIDGVVSMIAPTMHAISVKPDDGREILIHVGIDTVSLKGKGFRAQVSVGDKVSKGDVILTFDVSEIEKAGLDPTVIVVNPEN